MNMHPFPKPITGPPSMREKTLNVKLWSIDLVINMARLGNADALAELKLRATLGDTLAKLELRFGHPEALQSGQENG